MIDNPPSQEHILKGPKTTIIVVSSSIVSSKLSGAAIDAKMISAFAMVFRA